MSLINEIYRITEHQKFRATESLASTASCLRMVARGALGAIMAIGMEIMGFIQSRDILGIKPMHNDTGLFLAIIVF
jgi:hypothetical protein